MFDFTIQFGTARTSIAVRLDILSEVGRLLRTLAPNDPCPRLGVITDARVAPIYSAIVIRSLRGAGFDPFLHELPAGESSKQLGVAESMYQLLARWQLGRDGILVALGGGVVGDLAGFVAGTWMRGIRFAVFPTTLEADVDASIGGKTAVNLPVGKNLVGVFHQPILVAIDPKCLHTLDLRDVRAGLAESVKHALISSEDFLTWHEDQADAILSLHDETVTELVVRNVRVKAGIVEQDAREQTHTRMFLNFGHTIGHAIETCCGFSLRHGECVALGMLAACRMSLTMGLLEPSVVERVQALLMRFGLPTVMETPIGNDRILDAIHYDKKVRGGKEQFVVLGGIGQPVVRDDVPEPLIRDSYESLLP